MIKSKSLPTKLNEHIIKTIPVASYHDFHKLLLQGQQNHLTFGEYNKSNMSKKDKNKKLIEYFYKKLHARL